MQMDCEKLRTWFLSDKRDLPWRQTTDPYAIWISEVMLQQTQVAVVIPYFMHWMERFPTIRQLAEASLDEVIKAWEGLGYYSRARNLHAGAQTIVRDFNGQLPSNEEQLNQIKGLGPYTIGAILSFAFHQKKAAVDGNVLRVLTRYFGLEDDIAKGPVQKKLRQVALDLLPEEEPWVINEALIELGATVCQRKARCAECPLNKSCVAFKQGMTDRLPVKSKGAGVEKLYRAVAVIRCGSSYLVKRGEKGIVMSDLYEFPYFELGGKEHFSSEQVRTTINQTFALETELHDELPEVQHGFTRYHVRLYPVLLTCPHPKAITGMEWFPKDILKQLAFSSGHRRILHQL